MACHFITYFKKNIFLNYFLDKVEYIEEHEDRLLQCFKSKLYNATYIDNIVPKLVQQNINYNNTNKDMLFRSMLVKIFQ